MAYYTSLTTRAVDAPSYRKIRWKIARLVANVRIGQYVPTRDVIVRVNYVPRTGSRKKTLMVGLLLAGKINRNVLLYRKPQPAFHLTYPIFTPFRRRVKALGQIAAPVIVVGTPGSGMNLQHALGLALLSFGGMKY